MTEHPILIIGQGIAGTVLALKLQAQGLTFHIIDDGHRTSSSRAAAGLFNPLILKRRRLAWQAKEFLREAIPFYRTFDKAHGVSTCHETGIYRRIHDIEEYNEWQGLSANEQFAPFLGKIVLPDELSPQLESAIGYQEVLQAGWVDVDGFLDAAAHSFRENGLLTQGNFKESKVKLGDDLRYDGAIYHQIVLCNGRRAQQSGRFFQDLPFSPAKGHTLTIRAINLGLKQVVNGPCFVLPLGDDCYRIGSTYSWSNLDESTEVAEEEKLLKRFMSFCKVPYQKLGARAGVRPATRDRKPLMGRSVVDERIAMFGGLGSRAIMTAPRLANQLIAHLLSGESLDPEIDWRRSLV